MRLPNGPWVALIALLAFACPRPSPPGRDSGPPGRSSLRIGPDAGLLLTFFDRNAQMRTVQRIADVEPDARKAVMVTTMAGGLGANMVYIADLTNELSADTYAVRVEERGHWLDRVMPRASVARIPQAAKARRRGRQARAAQPRRDKQPSGADKTSTAANTEGAQPETPAEMPQVVMFSTTWCPSCRQARDYFTQKGVRYIDLDVEKNQAAAQKMVEIQQAQKLKVGAVPLIVVGNRVYQGFSQVHIDAALAQLQQQPG